jgi:hypothetical protein
MARHLDPAESPKIRDEYDVALRAYQEGWPSGLPQDNRFKSFVEGHRWKYHPDTVKWCPACDFRNGAISW